MASKSGHDTNTEAPFWTKHYPKGVPAFVEDKIAQYSSVLDVFEEAVGRFTTKPAYEQMGVTISYSELNRKAESFAAYLQNELKMKKGERIALQMPNCLQYPVALFGALKAGLVVVNVNPLYTEREMKHQFNDSGCTAVVIFANFAFHLEKILPETKIRHVITTEIADLMGFPKAMIINALVKHVKKMVPHYSLPDAVAFNDALKAGAALTYTRVKTDIEDIAVLQYTGGTTGVAKGAMLTHHNLIANMEQIYAWVKPLLKEGEEIGICALPMYHIFAFTLHGMALIKLGANNVLITNPRDIPAYIKTLKSAGFTVMTGVNTLFNALMNHPEFSKLDFSRLKISVAGGMALQNAVATRWEKVTGTVVIEGYGLTETSPLVSVNPVDGTHRIGTIGLPAPSTLVRMVDENDKEVPLGERGELCVKGPQVMKGYWQRPDETAKVFDKEGWFKSGDVGIMDKDGFCKIVDRIKDMILVSGFNVYPNEIEDVIASLPGVLEVAAIGVPNEHSGEVVKVFIVKKDPALTAEQVIAHAKANMTSYKVPKEVEFRTELPKTNVGKILRRALRDETQNKNPANKSEKKGV